MYPHPRPSSATTTSGVPHSTAPQPPTPSSADRPLQRNRSSVDLASYTERAGAQPVAMAARGQTTAGEAQDKEQTRLNQIISNFHTKAALTICSSRANLPQVNLKNGDIKQNRWFSIILDETDVLADDLAEWRRTDLSENKPSPMIIEIYLDTAHLNGSQALVLVDDTGKRWDVADALGGSSAESSPRATKSGARFCELVLERWTLHLADPKGFTSDDLNDLLPNVYKKGVVLFRSLYTFLRHLPAWKLHRRLGRNSTTHQALKLKFRIRKASSIGPPPKNSLHVPLCSSEFENESITDRYEFPPLLTPSGPLRCSVEYRQNCYFAVADAESLLSSRFLGLEEGLPTLPAGRSLPSSRTTQARERFSSTVAAGGGMATGARDRPRGLLGAYGSLGTYHATEKTNSPVSELRQRAEEADEENEDDEEDDGEDEESKAARRRQRRPAPAQRRRTSVNLIENPPFKAGSLASSPKPSPRPLPSPGTSGGKFEQSFLKYASTPSDSSRRTSLNTTLPQQHLRTPSVPNESAVASSGSASPKPAPVRYSSSFVNRPKRLASHSGKAAESNTSSGRGSSSSKEKSGQLNEGGSLLPGGGSGGDGGGGNVGKTDDDDDIAAFISQVENAKAFRGAPPKTRESVNLTKFSTLRDTNIQLAEEMSSSSLVINTTGSGSGSGFGSSTTPPSRRLSNVPGLSTSSSPSSRNAQLQQQAGGHMPHVRSRLSTHSIAEEIPADSRAGSGSGGASGMSGEGMESPTVQEEEEGDDEPFIFQHDKV